MTTTIAHPSPTPVAAAPLPPAPGAIAVPASSTMTGAGSAATRYSGIHTVSSPDGVSVFFVCVRSRPVA